MNKTYLIALILGVFGLGLAAYGFLHCHAPIAEPAPGGLLDAIRVPGLTEEQVNAMIEQVKAWIGLAVAGIAAGIAGLRHAIAKGQAILKAGDKLLGGLQESLPAEPTAESLGDFLVSVDGRGSGPTYELEMRVLAGKLLKKYTITRRP